MPKLLVDLAADGPIPAVADHGERGTDVHARRESRIGIAVLVHALVDQAHSGDPMVLDQSFRHGRAGPDLHRAGGHQLLADPLIELPDGKHQPVLLVQEIGRVGQLDRIVLEVKKRLEGADETIGRAQCQRAAAGADRVEQVKDFFLPDGRRHGNLGWVELGKAGADAPRARHHAGDAEVDAVCALVADDLGRHARHGRARQRWGTVVIYQGARERGQESAHRRAKAHAGNVNVHARAFELWGVFHLQVVSD